jgi:hypothetical protein
MDLLYRQQALSLDSTTAAGVVSGSGKGFLHQPTNSKPMTVIDQGNGAEDMASAGSPAPIFSHQ